MWCGDEDNFGNRHFCSRPRGRHAGVDRLLRRNQAGVDRLLHGIFAGKAPRDQAGVDRLLPTPRPLDFFFD